MSKFHYARGRITESIAFITQEIDEFMSDYADKSWKEYHDDRKLQKLMDRTVENILTAVIEICGTVLSEEGIKSNSYGETVKVCADFFNLPDDDQENLSKLAIQRNRLALRYLNYRWNAVKMFKERQDSVVRLVKLVLKRETS